jgi:hypothetical protein
MREIGRPRLEAVREIRLETRLTLTELDLVTTSVAAFVGGWLIGYITTIH